MNEITIEAGDGFKLAAHVFDPGRRPRAVVTIAGGTGIPQRFYRAYAEHLASAGMLAVTWDYRGIGASAGDARGGMTTWADDADHVLRWTHARYGDAPIVHVGHSFGGQVLGLMPSAARMLSSAVLIAAQSGFYGHWPMPSRLRMAALWHGVVPGLVRVFGELPAWAMGEALPADVAREWAEWCRTPGYLSGVVPAEKQFFRAFHAPILAYSFTDDDYAPGRSIEELLSWYRNAPITRRARTPERLGVRSIGHLGFFRKQNIELWNETLDWIESVALSAPVAA
jgi:predicted alpha/beta hydrolase